MSTRWPNSGWGAAPGRGQRAQWCTAAPTRGPADAERVPPCLPPPCCLACLPDEDGQQSIQGGGCPRGGNQVHRPLKQPHVQQPCGAARQAVRAEDSEDPLEAGYPPHAPMGAHRAMAPWPPRPPLPTTEQQTVRQGGCSLSMNGTHAHAPASTWLGPGSRRLTRQRVHLGQLLLVQRLLLLLASLFIALGALPALGIG